MFDSVPPRTRDVFDDDPDTGAAGSSPRTGVHFTDLYDDDDREEFREPSPSTASRSRSPCTAADSEDRLEPGRMHRRYLSRAKNVATDLGGASDVWTFFDPKESQGTQKRECLFCRCVLWSFFKKLRLLS
jgi:hypothetical protein